MTKILMLLLLYILVLDACSIKFSEECKKSSDLTQWYKHQQKIHYINQYQTRGIFAYIFNQQKIYASFFLQQNSKNNYRLILINPLGSSKLELNIKPNQVIINDNKSQYYTIDAAENIINALIGIPIPINSLCQWIIGLPDGATYFKLNNKHWLKELIYRHRGKTWKVIYNDYNTKIVPAMPSNMEILSNNQRIKLKMYNWIVK